jgi:hypothetical protein
VSKRHQQNRRKSYGRRQHELHERLQREPQLEEAENSLDDLAPGSMGDRFSFMDTRTSRLRYALGD